MWTPDHDQAFPRVKGTPSPPVLASCNPSLPTILETDTSHPKCWLHPPVGGKFWLVQCGLWFLTHTETRHATIKLELLAVVWPY